MTDPGAENLLVVLPVLDEHHGEGCVETFFQGGSAAGFAAEHVLVVDNTRHGWDAQRFGLRTHRDPDGHNLGVARSWNVGAREVLERGLDYLVLMSTAMRFGPILHTTWVRQMETFWGADQIEATGHSWHLIAIHRRLLETVGLFDPAFYPAYFEQTDWSRRAELLGYPIGWPNVWVNALSSSVGGHVHDEGTGRVQVLAPAGPLLEVYAAKWGGPKGEETFSLPYGDQPIDRVNEEPIPLLAERYGLGERGVGWW